MPVACSGEPTWLSQNGRALRLVVHEPDDPGRPRGLVVIAPPIGKEAIVTFRAVKTLADRAAEAGFVAIRFDWSGEGESAPRDPETSLAECWHQDLDAVLTFAETLLPDAKPSLIAIRLAACLASDVAADRLSLRVLWEPIAGRRFLRYHSSLRKVSLPDPVIAEGIELDGSWYSDADAADIKKLKYTETDSLLVTEADQAATALFVGSESQAAEIPMASIGAIVAALPQGDFPPYGFEPQTEVLLQVTDQQVCEEFVSVGPDELRSVLTRPVDTPVRQTVLLLPAAAEPRVGPCGLWVPASRQLAAQGIACLRVDRRGQGELVRHTVHAPNPYSDLAIDDGVAALRYLRERFDDPQITIVGLCAGSWMGVLASASEPVDQLIALNHVAWKPDPARYGHLGAAADAPEPSATPPAAPTPVAKLRRSLHLLRMRLSPTPLFRFLRHAHQVMMTFLGDHATLPMWRTAARLSRLEYPEPLLPRSVGTRFSFHFGSADTAYFDRCKGAEAFARWRRAGIDVERHDWPDLDHGLLAEASRRRALQILHDEIVTGR